MSIRINETVSIIFDTSEGCWLVCVNSKIVTYKCVNSHGQVYFQRKTFESKKDALDYCREINLINDEEFNMVSSHIKNQTNKCCGKCGATGFDLYYFGRKDDDRNTVECTKCKAKWCLKWYTHEEWVKWINGENYE